MGRKLTLRETDGQGHVGALCLQPRELSAGWRANEPRESSSSELSQGNFHHPGEHWLREETVLVIISWGLHVYHLLSQNRLLLNTRQPPQKPHITDFCPRCWMLLGSLWKWALFSMEFVLRREVLCYRVDYSGWHSGHSLQQAWVEPERHELFSIKFHGSLGRVPGASRTWASSTFLSVCLSSFLFSLSPSLLFFFLPSFYFIF